MKVFYITGVPGVGKSSVARALAERGVFSIDADSVKDLTHWIDNDTKEISEWHLGMSSDWYKKHKYICDREKLINLINTNQKDIVVVAGFFNNRSELWNLFNKVFFLYCNEETFMKRITERENHNFGKHILERENVLRWYKNFEMEIIEEGAIPINTEQPIEEVVDEIFSKF